MKNIKKIIVLILTLGVVFVFAACEEPQEITEIDGFEVKLNADNTYTVLGLVDRETEIDMNIPTKLGGKAVTAIGERAFEGYTNIRVANLPDSIKTIGKYAFCGCTLKSVKLPAGLEEIPDACFKGCLNLTSPDLHEGLKRIGKHAFDECISLINPSFPSSLTTIDSNAFMRCEKLQNVIVPETVTTLGTGVFSLCSNLASAEIKSEITELPAETFSYCRRLTEVTLPETIISYGDSAFESCVLLKNIKLNYNASYVGKRAFKNCKALEEIVLPDNITSIEDGLFEVCTALKKVSMPNGVKSIGNYAFYNDAALEDIELPSALETIGENAFFTCSLFNSAKLPEGVTTLSYRAFMSCSSMTYLYIPTALENIEYEAISRLKSLGKIECSADSKFFTVSDGVLYTKDMKTLVKYPVTAEKTEFIIPDGTEKVGSYAFSDMTTAVKVVIPATVKEIEARGFFRATSIKTFEYKGTVAEWEAMPKGENWNAKLTDYTVVCSDGEVNY